MIAKRFRLRMRGAVLVSAAALIMGSAVLPIPQPALAQGRLIGDAPDARLITVSAPDDAGLVTLTGEAGAVFPNAFIAIRNLYTQETMVTQASARGTFSARLFGEGNTPFLISPANAVLSHEDVAMAGSLPGGPATLITGAWPEQPSSGAAHFTAAGTVGGGSTFWSAEGRASSLRLQPGDPWTVELEIDLRALVRDDMRLSGELILQPVAAGDPPRLVPTTLTNNGWSSLLTPSGLPIDNLAADVPFDRAEVGFGALQRSGSGERTITRFTIRFDARLPVDLPRGLYVPLLRLYVSTPDGVTAQWDAPNVFGRGALAAGSTYTRLPIVLNVGDIRNARLLWTLLADIPSDGSRGLLAQEDAAAGYGLSNRVRWNSPTYILPRLSAGRAVTQLPLEPYLPNILPNRYDVSGAPLIPFTHGTLHVRVTRPDGQVEDFGSLPLIGAQVGSAALDEREHFGSQSPVDQYRLTTFDSALARYALGMYGEYIVRMTGSVEDVWGNRYTGGGTYSFLVAELLDLTPGVLPGTPFEVGDAFYAGAHVLPAVPAQIETRLIVYPLDGGAPIEHHISGQANDYGVFVPDMPPFRFETAGEYVVETEARFTDADGRLWAASTRSGGVIAPRGSGLIAHGARGLAGAQNAVPRPAWFDASAYAALIGASEPLRMRYPYHAGDIVWLRADAAGQMQPVIRAQAWRSALDEWLIERSGAAYAGSAVERGVLEGEIAVGISAPPGAVFGAPLVPDQIDSTSVTYLSAVRPGVTLRQFVTGGSAGGLPLYWDGDDPYNRQIGAGAAGDQPGDYAFLFGGIVIRAQAGEGAPIRESAIYGALAVSIDPNDPRGVRVLPPGRPANRSTALMMVNEQPVEMFFHPTAVQPGDVLILGETLSVAGQVAPTLPANVRVRVTAPSGAQREFRGSANAIGYFYEPSQDFAVDETGVWTVDITVLYDGMTSAGVLEAPGLAGGILGGRGELQSAFSVYVVAADAEMLPWNSTLRDTTISAALPYNLSFAVPSDWTRPRAYHTVTTPGVVIEDGDVRLGGQSFIYTYAPAAISRAFPNIESDVRETGAAASDPRRLTFALEGTDSTGQRVIRARVITVFHDRLISLMP